MRAEVEYIKILQERIDFFPHRVSIRYIRAANQYRFADRVSLLNDINRQRTGLFQDLLKLRERQRISNPIDLTKEYFNRVFSSLLIDRGLNNLDSGSVSLFLTDIDMAAGIKDMLKCVQFNPSFSGKRVTYYQTEDYETTQALLLFDPTGRLLMREAANRVYGRYSAFKARPAPKGFIPQYMRMGAEVVEALYPRIYSAAKSIQKVG